MSYYIDNVIMTTSVFYHRQVVM